MRDVLRAALVAAHAAPGSDDAELVECHVEPIVGSTGAATREVARLTGRVRADRGAGEWPFTMIRKTFRPVPGGRHAAAARDRRHWAYWRREPLAYASRLLPAGPDLAAPRCYAVTEDAVYLADVTGPAEEPGLAARRLGAWQAGTAIPDVPWLGGHQLAQRLAAGGLDWSGLDVPGTVPALWDRRDEQLAALRKVPPVICHGDFSAGNLIAGRGVTVVLDWGTLGAGPLGADLAQLALSLPLAPDPLDGLFDAYLAGLGGRFDPELAALGYRVTLALAAASRAHWMLSRGRPVPPGYLDHAIREL